MNKASRYILGISIGLVALGGMTACHKSVSAQSAEQQGPDPTDQNMAPVDSSGQPINDSQQPAAQYVAGGAPIERRDPGAGQPAASQSDQYQSQVPLPDDQNYAQDELYNDQDASGEPPVEADQPPPELPVYQQPEAPDANYLWTPGYWGYSPMGYYWVPGAWVAAPYYGALWTPGYWGFYGGRYRFHRGFWGLHIGFYGGINYGYGYFGEGYRGGYWNGNNFYYNRSINRVPSRITNVYVRNVTIVNAGNRVSFNGGRGGLQVRPRPTEIAAMRGPRIPPMATQREFQRQASENRQQFYNQNRGRPAMVTAARPIVADKGIQRPTQVQPGNGGRPGFQNGGQNRPGQPGNVGRPGFQPGGENRPGQQGQPGNVARPGGQPGNVTRPGFQQGNENRPGQNGRPDVPLQNRPQVQPTRPTPQQPNRPDVQPGVRPTPEARPAPQPQVRPNPQFRPDTQQARPNVQQPRTQQEVRPNPQFRPETQQPRPNVQQPRPAESRPAPQVRTPPPAQAPRPAPQVRSAPPPQQARPAHTEPQHPN